MSSTKGKYVSRIFDWCLLRPTWKKLLVLVGFYLVVVLAVTGFVCYQHRVHPLKTSGWSAMVSAEGKPAGQTEEGSTPLELVLTMSADPGCLKDFLNNHYPPGYRVIAAVLGLGAWVLICAVLTALMVEMHNRRVERILAGHSRYSLGKGGHGVILGWGPMGVSAVKKLRDQYGCRKVLILSRVDAGSIRAELTSAYEFRWQDAVTNMIVYNGSPAAPEQLDLLALDAAKMLLYLGEPGDGEIAHDSQALNILALVAQRVRSRPVPLPCYFSILSIGLFNRLAVQDLPETLSPGIEFHPFSPYGNWARRLWSVLPLDANGKTDGRRYYPPLAYRPLAAGAVVRLFILGFGNMGRALAIHAARIAHYPAGAKLRVTVVDPEAASLKDTFFACLPIEQLEPLGIQIDFMAARAEAPAVRKSLAEAVADPGQIVTVAVCLPAPDAALETAISLPPEIRDSATPVLLRQRAPLSAEGSMLARGLLSHLYIFGSEDDCGLDKSLDRLAMAAHAIYLEKAKASGKYAPDKKPSHREWERLPAMKRVSNLNQTDAILERLAAWGYGLEPSAKPDVPVNPADVGDHCPRPSIGAGGANTSLAGWSIGPVDDLTKRTHPDLRPFDQLPEGTKDYDRSVAQSIPDLLCREYNVRMFNAGC